MKQTLPQRLRALREENGMTQEKLAKELGVARMTIVCYESGKNSPDGNMLSKMCAIFDCTPDYLIGYSDFKNPQNRQAWMASVKTLGAAIGTLPQERQEALVTALNSLLRVAENMAALLWAYAEMVRRFTAALVSGKAEVASVYEAIEDGRDEVYGSVDRVCRSLMGVLLQG